jgi:hypothetical protein
MFHDYFFVVTSQEMMTLVHIVRLQFQFARRILTSVSVVELTNLWEGWFRAGCGHRILELL